MGPRYIRLPWKKNFRKLPDFILAQVENVSSDEIVVACSKRIPCADLAAHQYGHLGVHLANGAAEPTYPPQVVPNERVGRTSRTNVEGREIVRRDLPKVTKTYTWESPNFGDWAMGSHLTSMDREVYQRDFIPPKELAISIEVAHSSDPSKLDFTFRVEEVLDRTTPDFHTGLLFAVNLLQENTGAAGVYASHTPRASYLQTLEVPWEVLPLGNRDAMLRDLTTKLKLNGEQTSERLISRFELLARLQPTALIAGTDGFRRYFGAQFSDRLVVFENIDYGNAIYAMFEKWEILSMRSRTELLRGDRDEFTRVPHRSGWERQLERLIQERR